MGITTPNAKIPAKTYDRIGCTVLSGGSVSIARRGCTSFRDLTHCRESLRMQYSLKDGIGVGLVCGLAFLVRVVWVEVCMVSKTPWRYFGCLRWLLSVSISRMFSFSLGCAGFASMGNLADYPRNSRA